MKNLSKTYSSTVLGIEAKIIEVEVDLTGGLHSFTIVGLGDKAVGEAKHRVSSAIKNTGLKPPLKTNQKVIINLAPADIKKEGSGFDLAIAIGYLISSKQLACDASRSLFLGELALEGALKEVRGVLPAVIRAKEAGMKEVFVPLGNASEAALVPGISVYGASSLKEVVDHLEGRAPLTPSPQTDVRTLAQTPSFEVALEDIRGQYNAKRALEIAAAGGHNLYMGGPPGAGKTLLAKAITSILPPMTLEEVIEVSSIWSSAGKLTPSSPVVASRPFRSPHHTISEAALIGGGTPPKPGEITLAHRGVLFLDEFPEFHRDVVESLRQPLEEGAITVSRANFSAKLPARFIFIAAQNPCPCGKHQSPNPKEFCECTRSKIANYRRKLSGPIGDRIDIHLSVSVVNPDELFAPKTQREEGESLRVRKRVERARLFQKERLAKEGIAANSEMGVRQVERFCKLSGTLQDTALGYLKQHTLSTRSYHRVLKVARTIADLEGHAEIEKEDLMQALQFRVNDRAEL